MKNCFNFILDFFLNYILNPVCIRCESIDVEASYFCHDCYKQFLFPRLYEKSRRLVLSQCESHDITYLLDWIPYESDALSHLVYLLKKRRSRFAWKDIVKNYDMIKMTDGKEHLKGLIIPVPGRDSTKSSYHTGFMSHYLSQNCGLQVLNILTFQTGVQEQKRKNKCERQLIKLAVNEEFTLQLCAADYVVLIDDIVTTGSTLAAATKAIRPYVKNHCQIVILTLFSRDII